MSLVLILLIPLLLVMVWFKDGNILAVGESGIPFYNFQIAYESNKNAWAHYALGYPTNISVSAKPMYWLLAQLQNHGIPGFLLQASFFWVVLVVSGLSIYYLTKNLFPSLNNQFIFLAVLFYWFNPFSMVNVWNRFLNNFFVFYLLLPLSLLFFIKGLQTRHLLYALMIGLSSTVFAYALSSAAFIILLWLVLVYTAVFYIFVYNDFRSRLFVIKFLSLSLFFWFLTNLWWVSQTFSYIYSSSFSTVRQTSFSPENNRLIFSILSQKLGNLIYILKLQHASFFGPDSMQWVKLYTFPPVAFLSFAFSLIIFTPLFSRNKKNSVLLLSGLFILGTLLSMGNNPPFGQLFNLAFEKFGFLQVFRNSFEKFGFLLPLAAAPLFAYGMHLLNGKIFEKWRKYTYYVIIAWLMGILGLPYWTGLVFTAEEYPANIPSIGYQVKVPNDYQQASKWLNSKTGNFRLLAFPLGDEGITYNWEKGYAGVELSNQLLPITSVSFQTNIPFYNDISGGLEEHFLKKESSLEVMNILNAKYIMLRNDINWRIREIRDPQSIFNRLKEKGGQFKMIEVFGRLAFWENTKWIDRRVYLSDYAIAVSPQPKISDSQFFLSDNDVLIGRALSLNDIKVNQEVVHPIARLSLGDSLTQSTEGGQDIFPHVKFPPSSSFYRLILLKEKMDLGSITNISKKLDFIIMLLGKRLVEAKLESGQNNTSGVLIAIQGYKSLLDEITSIFAEYRLSHTNYNKQVIKQERLYGIFAKHEVVLSELISHFPENEIIVEQLKDTQRLLDSKLSAENIQPIFGFREEDGFTVRKRIAYRFKIITSGEYELFWGDEYLDKYYKKNGDDRIILQVDSKIVPAKRMPGRLGLQTLGKMYFDSGIHEISLNTPNEVNLVKAEDEFTLTVQHGEVSRAFPINNYDPYAEYTVAFDYWIKKGLGVGVLAEENNAKIKLGKIEYGFADNLGSDNYYYGEKHFISSFKLNNKADTARLILKVNPWNDCETIFYTRNKNRCKDESFREPYDRTTEVIIRNLSVTRDLIDEPILVKSNLEKISSTPKADFEKIGNMQYIINITDAKEPYILILSELFDPGWKILTTSGNEVQADHFIVNVYANGWKIDKLGDYQIIIKYAPQDLLFSTEIISQVAFLSGSLIVIWKLRRRYVKDN